MLDTSPAPARQIRVGSQRLSVQVRPGMGRPLVLCNGIGASLGMLDPFVAELEATIPAVRFDAPGVGGSALPAWPYSFATLACLVGQLLTELGYDEFDVLGISWGGGLAQQVALQMPRRCRRLVLVSTGTGSLMVPAHPRVLAKMITPRRYRDPEYAASIAADLYGGSMRDSPEEVRRVLQAHAGAGSRRGYALQLLAAAGWASLPFLPLIRQPTLILAGSDDPIIPVANGRLMNRLLPHSRLEIFPDGHLGLVTQASVLAPIVAQFLRPEPAPHHA